MNKLTVFLIFFTIVLVSVYSQSQTQEADEGRSKLSRPVLAGPVWRWQETVYNDGKSVKPTDETRKYTIQFQPDGNFRAHMDCNTGGGQYLFQSNRIAIGSIKTTLIACPPGSLVQDFVGPLKSIGTYSFEAQNSQLKLKFESATVSFVKQE